MSRSALCRWIGWFRSTQILSLQSHCNDTAEGRCTTTPRPYNHIRTSCIPIGTLYFWSILENHGKTCEKRLSGCGIESGYHVLYHHNFVYIEPTSINPVGRILDRYGQTLLLRRER